MPSSTTGRPQIQNFGHGRRDLASPSYCPARMSQPVRDDVSTWCCSSTGTPTDELTGPDQAANPLSAVHLP